MNWNRIIDCCEAVTEFVAAIFLGFGIGAVIVFAVIAAESDIIRF